MPMADFTQHLADWRTNEQAFHAALTGMRGAAADVGLILDRPEGVMNGWPYLLRAEVRPSGSRRVLSGMDVGLNRNGEMLLRTLPGTTRKFANFRPRDEVFYLRVFGRLVESALKGSAQGSRTISGGVVQLPFAAP
jgi:hypothetical protein